MLTAVPPPRPLPAAPALASIDGQPIEWSPWTVTGPVFICPGGLSTCEQCGETRQLAATGLVRSDLPPWPVRRLFASACPSCPRRAVYDTGPAGDRFDDVAEGAQLDLFASAP